MSIPKPSDLYAFSTSYQNLLQGSISNLAQMFLMGSGPSVVTF